jgi:HSP20 family protein
MKGEKKATKRPKNLGYKLSRSFVDVMESGGVYEVQLNVPGLAREELIVYGNNNSLSVDASGSKDNSKYRSFHRNITMPANADTELTVAEYKNSILHLYVPKTNQPCEHESIRIVVY